MQVRSCFLIEIFALSASLSVSQVGPGIQREVRQRPICLSPAANGSAVQRANIRGERRSLVYLQKLW
jgi:hypothetical protein